MLDSCHKLHRWIYLLTQNYDLLECDDFYLDKWTPVQNLLTAIALNYKKKRNSKPVRFVENND
jgi:hypothetical protein